MSQRISLPEQQVGTFGGACRMFFVMPKSLFPAWFLLVSLFRIVCPKGRG